MSLVCSVNIMTNQENTVQLFQAYAGNISPLHGVKIGPGAYPASYSMHKGISFSYHSHTNL